MVSSSLSFSCSDCDYGSFVTHEFGENDSIILDSSNTTFVSGSTLWYQKLLVNPSNLSFSCLSNINNSLEGIDFSVDSSDATYTYLRLLLDHYAIGYSSTCGNDLTPYKFYVESGCMGYIGTNCSTKIFTGMDYSDYTLIKEDIVSLVPNWAYYGRSCLYSAINTTTMESVLIHAFRVKGNGGQFCKVQNEWDFYIYTQGFNEHYIPLTRYSFRDAYFVNYDCILENNLTDFTYNLSELPFDLCINFSIPSNYTNWTDPSPVIVDDDTPFIWYDYFYNGSCSNKFNMFILFLWILLIFIMIYLRLWIFASFLTLMFAVVLLFCGVNIIFLVVLLTISLALGFLRSRAK